MSREATAQPASAHANAAGTQPEVAPRHATARRSHEAGRRGRLVRRALVAADVLGLIAAFAAAQLLFGSSGSLAPVLELGIFAATLPAWTLLARAYGLYANDAERAYHSTSEEVATVFNLVTVGAWTFFVGTWLAGIEQPNVGKLAAFWLLAIAFVTGARVAAREICRTRESYRERAIVVGAGSVGQLVARKLLQHPEYGVEVTGFVDADPRPLRPELEHVPVLGPPARLPELVSSLEADRVVVAFSGDTDEERVELVRALSGLGVRIDVVPRLFDLVAPNARLHAVEGLPLLTLTPSRLSPASLLAKRAIDIVGASLGLVLAAPLFGVVALLVKRDSPGPVFFRQTRLGLGMRQFTMLKFRTMRVDTDDAVHEAFIRATLDPAATPSQNGLYKLERGDAVTQTGRWLRRTSLDELPQLVNVLRGEMSLVGPRPCIPYEIESFAPHHFERFQVPAGITGLWQVTARSRTTFGEALDMDVAYARGWSLGLDLVLILRTARQLLRLSSAA